MMILFKICFIVLMVMYGSYGSYLTGSFYTSDKDNSGWFCVSSTTIELSYGEFLNGPVLSHASTTEIFRDTDDSWLRHAICIAMRHARHVGEQKRSGRLFLIGYSLGIVGFMAFC